MASIWDDPATWVGLMASSRYTPSSFPSASEVRQQAHGLSSEIYSSWQTLHAIVIRKETMIRKRWEKKNKNARATILLRAWPDMPTRHRPDFWAVDHPESSKHAERYMDSFKYPYINLEDLTKQRPLLLLLNARARSSPGAFPHADIHACRIGMVQQVIRPPFLNDYTMYLAGQQSSDSYGKILAWYDDMDAFHQMHTGLQFLPGEGILALEIERTILKFLIKCCQEIFPDLSFTELTSLDAPIQPEPPALVSTSSPYVQLSTLTAEAPYRAPAPQDFEALKTLIAARRAAALDHIWDLREDPGYFVSIAMTFSDHSSQKILDPSGKPHPNSDDKIFWQTTLTNILLNAYDTFLMWDQLLHRIKAVLGAMPVAQLNPGSELPGKLLHAFLDLRDALEHSVKEVIEDFGRWVAASPAVRPSYSRQPNTWGSMEMRIRTKVPSKKGSMLYLISALSVEKERFLFGLTNLVDEMQRRIDDSKEERSNFSELVMTTFSDLALMSYTVNQVETFFPWSARFDELAADFQPSQDERELPSFQLLVRKQKDLPSLVDSVMPFSKKLSYPAHKAVTEDNTNTMRAAEANLDKYWNIVDRHFGENGKALNNMLERHGAEVRTVKRALPYSPQPPDNSQKAREKTRASPTADNLIQSDHIKLLILDDRPQRPTVELPKEKTKTRGIPIDGMQNQTQTQQPSQSVPIEPTIEVSKRAIKVFKSLFFTPSASAPQATSGEIPWTEFLHAMASAGCSVQKLQGSVWQFIPKDKDSYGWHGIHFHEPHPSNKIPFTMARRIGRRLNRNYGWSAKTFVARSTHEI